MGFSHMFRNDTRAQSVQIGAVLLFGMLIVALSTWQAFQVPAQNEEIEFNHNQEVQKQMIELRTTVNSLPGISTPRSTTIDLGVRYPSRTIFRNPPPVSGTIRTVKTTDSGFNVSIENASASGEIGDFWNGTARQYNTGAIEYEPRYNEYRNAPRTIYEHSVLYNKFGENQELSITGQTLVRDDTITMVAVNGTLREDRVNSISVDIEPISTRTRTVEVGNESHNMTISTPTRMNVSEWREVFEDELDDGNVTAVDTTDIEALDDYSMLHVELKRGTYSLQLVKVGVGTQTARDKAAYITDQNRRSFNITSAESQRITVETRNKYNERVNATVNDNITQGNGTIRREKASGGEYTYRYLPFENTTGEVDVTFTLAKNSTAPDVAADPEARTVTTSITVTPPANGTATQPEYKIDWDEQASSTRFIAGGFR
ncbi:hypothetical protein [Halovenus salina]|uniref:hypothetical protein n=1 Tax=Halovenus salina TaxID=1510225 RepID=UPI002260F3A5|nr:hypothetical protein [Halovenus salina]